MDESPSQKKCLHLFQHFFLGKIFLPQKSLLRCLSDLAVNAIVGADFMGDEIDPE